MWNFEAVFLKTSSGQLLPRNFGSYWFCFTCDVHEVHVTMKKEHKSWVLPEKGSLICSVRATIPKKVREKNLVTVAWPEYEPNSSSIRLLCLQLVADWSKSTPQLLRQLPPVARMTALSLVSGTPPTWSSWCTARNTSPRWKALTTTKRVPVQEGRRLKSRYDP